MIKGRHKDFVAKDSKWLLFIYYYFKILSERDFSLFLFFYYKTENSEPLFSTTFHLLDLTPHLTKIDQMTTLHWRTPNRLSIPLNHSPSIPLHCPPPQPVNNLSFTTTKPHPTSTGPTGHPALKRFLLHLHFISCEFQCHFTSFPYDSQH